MIWTTDWAEGRDTMQPKDLGMGCLVQERTLASRTSCIRLPLDMKSELLESVLL